MARSPTMNKQPIMGCHCRPYQETGMRGFGLYLWWAFCTYATGKLPVDIIHNYLIITNMEKCICTNCGYQGKPVTMTRGGIGTEIILWLLFIIPGLLYSIWRMSTKYTACPKCKKQTMIPIDSLMGKKILSELESFKSSETGK